MAMLEVQCVTTYNASFTVIIHCTNNKTMWSRNNASPGTKSCTRAIISPLKVTFQQWRRVDSSRNATRNNQSSCSAHLFDHQKHCFHNISFVSQSLLTNEVPYMIKWMIAVLMVIYLYALVKEWKVYWLFTSCSASDRVAKKNLFYGFT